MFSERLIGGAAILLGGFLLTVLIPNHVTSMAGPVNPSLFPTIAAWLFVILGVAQIVMVRTATTEINGWYEFIRLLGLALFVFVSLLLMPRIGYLPSAVLLAGAVCALMLERRLGWLALSIGVVPLGVWFTFEVILGRPLPPIPL
ncbi:tripartite tricarboxylate transporter TctB family protein [Mariluticola halotolerans]|uniref:tripartite tricarboxylate transporter TctB family protein n=1 Tax=Mariluticola halotolerans TaxID=2909283 RepID=UPI0026E22181|nr:tripartite tricarboxylate transporter TctB family protein [Mariluticola halotolerans]UJQ94716.1 tripartite tricarboxylate transporter TctB family protein [Mariluticola halotolerans]